MGFSVLQHAASSTAHQDLFRCSQCHPRSRLVKIDNLLKIKGKNGCQKAGRNFCQNGSKVHNMMTFHMVVCPMSINENRNRSRSRGRNLKHYLKSSVYGSRTFSEPKALNGSVRAVSDDVCLLKIPYSSQRYSAIRMTTDKHISRAIDSHRFHSITMKMSINDHGGCD